MTRSDSTASIEMPRVTIPEAIAMVEHIAVAQHEPLFIHGQPGIAKSQSIAQLCRRNNWVLLDLRLSQYESIDLRGFPQIDAATQLTRWFAPSTMPFVGNDAFPDDRTILLFLDELPSAMPSTQAVAYQLVNDKRIGEHVLKPNVRIVAAGNRDGDRGVQHRMASPLANRFTHVEVFADVQSFSVWALGEGLSPDGIAFLNMRKDLLNTFDPSSGQKVFATPRTWEKALRYYGSAMPQSVKDHAMAGAIGVGIATEFAGFLRVKGDLPDLNAIKKSPMTVPVPTEMSAQYAVSIALSGSMTLKTIAPFYKYLCRMPAEIATMAMRLAMLRDGQLMHTPEFTDFATQFRQILQPGA